MADQSDLSKAPKEFTPSIALDDAVRLASSIGSERGECPRCSPDPCTCDKSPSGPGTVSLLPEEIRSKGNLFQTNSWKEYKATQGKLSLRKRKGVDMKTTALNAESGRKRAGGLPSAPPPIEEWVPPVVEQLKEEPVFQESPKGPTANEAFRAQKKFEDGEEPQEEIDPLEYIQANFDNAPSSSDVELWKQRFGDVFITGLTDDEVFIWRTVKRLEYKNIMARVAAAMQTMAKTQTAMANVDEGRNSLFIEELCKTCILWPSIDQNQLAFSKAGTLDALANLILEGSNFLAHSLAVRLTRKI